MGFVCNFYMVYILYIDQLYIISELHILKGENNMIRTKFMTNLYRGEDGVKQTDLINEELEDDELDLNEWAFLMGYSEDT